LADFDEIWQAAASCALIVCLRKFTPDPSVAYSNRQRIAENRHCTPNTNLMFLEFSSEEAEFLIVTIFDGMRTEQVF